MDKKAALMTLLKREEDYLAKIKEYIFIELRSLLGDSEAAKEGAISKLRDTTKEWLYILDKNISGNAKSISDITGNLEGILFPETGDEIGIDYMYIPAISYRIPSSFMLLKAGVYMDSDLLADQPLYPTKMLVIGQGRFPSYYSFRNRLTHTEYVDTLNKPGIYAKGKKQLFREYIAACVEVNSYEPRHVSLIEF